MGALAFAVLLAAAGGAGAQGGTSSCSFVHCPAAAARPQQGHAASTGGAAKTSRWRPKRLRMGHERAGGGGGGGESPSASAGTGTMDGMRAATLDRSSSLPGQESVSFTEEGVQPDKKYCNSLLGYPVPEGWDCSENSYHKIDQDYPGLKLVHEHPPVYVVEDFLSSAECQDAISRAEGNGFVPAGFTPVEEDGEEVDRSVSKVFWEDIPYFTNRMAALTGILTDEMTGDNDYMNGVLITRYLGSMFYAIHSDAYDLSVEAEADMARKFGQRYCSVLVYLNNVENGGATKFPKLNLRVQPRRGQALVFFPATLEGTQDPMVDHFAESAVDNKYIALAFVARNPFE